MRDISTKFFKIDFDSVKTIALLWIKRYQFYGYLFLILLLNHLFCKNFIWLL
jgi:hypothetical protein